MINIEILAKKHYDKHRYQYENERNREFYGYFCGEMLKKIHNNDFKNVLEIGCGTGISTEKIVSDFQGSKIHAFDISKKMLEIAQKKPALKNVIFHQNIEKLPNISFDLVISNFSYHWWSSSFCFQIKKLLNSKTELAICAPMQSNYLANGNLAIAKVLKELKLSKAKPLDKLTGVTLSELRNDFHDLEFMTSKKSFLETFKNKNELIMTLKIRGSLLAIASAFGIPEIELERQLLQNLDNNGNGFKMHWEAMIALKTEGVE